MNETPDMKEMTWRCISARRHFGHWEYLYDEPVIESHLQIYLVDVPIKMGAERITLHKFMKLGDALNAPTWEPMKGAENSKSIRFARRIDDFHV